jgi:hypothetical protein
LLACLLARSLRRWTLWFAIVACLLACLLACHLALSSTRHSCLTPHAEILSIPVALSGRHSLMAGFTCLQSKIRQLSSSLKNLLEPTTTTRVNVDHVQNDGPIDVDFVTWCHSRRLHHCHCHCRHQIYQSINHWDHVSGCYILKALLPYREAAE